MESKKLAVGKGRRAQGMGQRARGMGEIKDKRPKTKTKEKGVS